MDKREVIEGLRGLKELFREGVNLQIVLDMAIEALEQEPTAEYSSDVISRQAAIDALNGLIDRFEQILRDIRETNVDDSVCGMCEYDGAYIGQSGDWCNECPGFDKDDCFKLSDECRKRWGKSVDLPSAQPFTSEQIQTMQELESAQVEKAYELGKADRPTGHWIETEHSTNENGFKKWIEIRCPFCGHEPVYENIDDMEFCPKCGADMRGGDTK